jgi:hypothetical protein
MAKEIATSDFLLPDFLPRAAEISETATQAPKDSFHTDLYCVN